MYTGLGRSGLSNVWVTIGSVWVTNVYRIINELGSKILNHHEIRVNIVATHSLQYKPQTLKILQERAQ